MRYIYLDYAATTPIDPRVAAKMNTYLTYDGIFGNPSSPHSFGQKASQAVEFARYQVAELVHADPAEIIFTSGATESNNFALKSAAHSHHHKGRHIITLNTEHKAILASCQQLAREGYPITYLSPESNGLLDIDKLKAALREDTILVSIMHVNNEIGVIQDIHAIANLTHSRGILLHVDAAQSPGKTDINLNNTPVDLMSFCAHKVYGPKGVGALYIRKNLQSKINAQIHGGGQEQGLRSGTLAVHQIVGMGEAFQIAHHEMMQNIKHIHHLRDKFLSALQPLGVRTNGDLLHCVPHILNLCFETINATDLLNKLPQIAASTASACHGKSAEASYVLRALGLNEEEAKRSIRFSFGKLTTEEEINEATNQIKKNLV